VGPDLPLLKKVVVAKVGASTCGLNAYPDDCPLHNPKAPACSLRRQPLQNLVCILLATFFNAHHLLQLLVPLRCLRCFLFKFTLLSCTATSKHHENEAITNSGVSHDRLFLGQEVRGLQQNKSRAMVQSYVGLGLEIRVEMDIPTSMEMSFSKIQCNVLSIRNMWEFLRVLSLFFFDIVPLCFAARLAHHQKDWSVCQ
jgi:hypothetical protein